MEDEQLLSGDITDNSWPLIIGNECRQQNDPFDGIIDDVRIYNRAFSVTEICQLYHDPVQEIPGNGIDDDCNPATPAPWEVASVVNAEHKGFSDIPNYLLFLCMPIGTVILWKGLRRRK